MTISKLLLDGIEIIAVDTRMRSTRSPQGVQKKEELLQSFARIIADHIRAESVSPVRKVRRFTLRRLPSASRF